MEFNLKNVLQWMIDNEYGVLIGKEFVLTNKVNTELNGLRPSTAVIAIHRPVTAVTKVINPTSKKDIWNKFIADADIPHRVKSTTGGTYTVRQFGAAAVNELIKIISDPSIDYHAFVESTKHYYKTVTFKALLSNYLLKQIWRGEYDEWIKGNRNVVTSGENRFED